MDVIQCINARRSVRQYAQKEISDDILRSLIQLGTRAATGSNMQPWGFVLIKGKEKLNRLSSEAKAYIVGHLSDFPQLKQYEKSLRDERFSIFNGASYLLIIYGDTKSHFYINDCTLAAGNIMLAAHSMGIGSCWIGFAEHFLNTKEFKVSHNIPEGFELVCPLTLGYIADDRPARERKEPNIFYFD